MPKVFTSKTQKIGELGENLACKFLTSRGYLIKDRNFYTTKGEIDVIAEKEGKLYFVEVKSIRKQLISLESDKDSVSYETYNPADNINYKKIQKMMSVVSEYKARNGILKESKILALLVYIDLKNKICRVEELSL